jgi:hypothetical protein
VGGEELAAVFAAVFMGVALLLFGEKAGGDAMEDLGGGVV